MKLYGKTLPSSDVSQTGEDIRDSDTDQRQVPDDSDNHDGSDNQLDAIAIMLMPVDMILIIYRVWNAGHAALPVLGRDFALSAIAARRARAGPFGGDTFSQRHTVEMLTPISAASCLWVSPHAFRISLTSRFFMSIICITHISRSSRNAYR